MHSERGLNSLELLDNRAKESPKGLPKEYSDGICQAVASVTMHIPDIDTGADCVGLLMAIVKNAYRAGYVDGCQETEVRYNIPTG